MDRVPVGTESHSGAPAPAAIRGGGGVTGTAVPGGPGTSGTAAFDDGALEGLTRPLLEALARISGFESTYLMVFDWARREQQARFVYSSGAVLVAEGLAIALPTDVSEESLPGVTRSPAQLHDVEPDSLMAKGLGLGDYVSVPVLVARHRLFGMLCGASQGPGEVTEGVVSVMESFARMIADQVTRAASAATAARAEKAEERLRRRGQFLAEAEHQLKTPLTVVGGASRALLDSWADLTEEKRTSLLTMIVRNAGDLGDRVDELLVEATAEVRARELVAAPIELAPFVETIVAGFAATSPSHDVVVDVDAGVSLWADANALFQTLGHLLDNAIKYSPDGGVVTVRAGNGSGDVQIDVVDEGIGVPTDVDIFQAFRRHQHEAHAATPGVGLGLHIVRNFVGAMGGSVAARRNDGPGSTITVRLPNIAGPDSPPESAGAPHGQSRLASGGKGPIVLCLEGELDIATAPGLAETLAKAAAVDDADLVIDVSRVTFLDAAIIGALVRGRNELHRKSRRLILRSPSRRTRAVLGICQLDDMVETELLVPTRRRNADAAR